jgi:thiamine-phosphate pyrophosphorylase
MTQRALKAGVKWIQLRDKERSRREIYEEALSLRAITTEKDAVFLVNDHPGYCTCGSRRWGAPGTG